jgi:hypothetical protein
MNKKTEEQETSEIMAVIELLEGNGFRVIKAEVEIDNAFVMRLRHETILLRVARIASEETKEVIA